MQEEYPSKISVDFQRTVLYYVLEGKIIHNYRFKNIKYEMTEVISWLYMSL
jgi:hypothetical protein